MARRRIISEPIVIGVRVSAEMNRRLEEAARRLGFQNKSELVRFLLTVALDALGSMEFSLASREDVDALKESIVAGVESRLGVKEALSNNIVEAVAIEVEKLEEKREVLLSEFREKYVKRYERWLAQLEEFVSTYKQAIERKPSFELKLDAIRQLKREMVTEATPAHGVLMSAISWKKAVEKEVLSRLEAFEKENRNVPREEVERVEALARKLKEMCSAIIRFAMSESETQPFLEVVKK